MALQYWSKVKKNGKQKKKTILKIKSVEGNSEETTLWRQKEHTTGEVGKMFKAEFGYKTTTQVLDIQKEH